MELVNFFVLILGCILLVSGNADAKVKRGEINSDNDIEFLGTFYFLNREDNVLDYEIKYPADQCCYRLVIFDDSYPQWGAIRPHGDRLTCRDKINRVTDLDHKIKLSDRGQACHMETDDAGLKWLVCRGLIDFASRQRPQSYFVHLTNCRSNRKGFKNVTYSLHMTNGNNGLMKEFAENQKFIMETDLAFFLGYLAMTIIATRFRYVLLQKKLLHLTYRLFYSSLFLKTVCLLLLNIELSRFARTGLEMTTVQDTAEILSCLSSILFVSVLLLVSKGFSITRAHPSLVGTVKMVFYGLLYSACYAVVFFDQRVLLDPQDILVSRTNLSASGLIGVKFAGCIFFVVGCFFSIKNYPNMVLFYVPFTVFFSVWFVTEPIYRLLSLVDTYKVLQSPNIWNGIDLALSFAGHAYFLFITRPDHLNKRFPFYLPAAKVSFRDVDEDLDNPYQPTDDFYSIFQTGKKPTETDTTLTIPDDPEHFLTPVLPFNARSDECLVLPRPTSPIIVPAVSTTAANIVDNPTVIPTVSATVACETYSLPPSEDIQLATSLTDFANDKCRVPATRRDRKPRPHLAVTLPEARRPTSSTPTGFVAMPKVVAQPTIKIKPATSSRIKALPKLADIPQKDQAAVGISTVAVPKGGFSIFTVQKQQVKPESPLPSVKSSSESLKTPLIKTIEGPGSAVQLTKTPQYDRLVACRPVVEPLQIKATEESGSDALIFDGCKGLTNGTQHIQQITVGPLDEPLKIKASPPIKTIKGPGSAVQLTKAPQYDRLVTSRPVVEPLQIKTTEESGSDALVIDGCKGLNNGTQYIQQIIVRSVDEPMQIKATGESVYDAVVLDGCKGLNNGTQNIQQITVRSVDEPLQIKAIGESDALMLDGCKGLTNDTQKVRQITVKPADDPLKSMATGESGLVPKVPETKDQTNGTSKVRLINVKPADDPFQTKAVGESRSVVQASSSESLTKSSDNVQLITVRSVDEPLQTKASVGPGSVAQLPRSQSVVNESSGLPSGKSKVTVGLSAPKLAWTTEPVKPQKIKCCQVPKPFPDPLPAPKILNWTIEPPEIEHSKSSPGLITGQPVMVQEPVSPPEPQEITSISCSQGETLKKSFQDPGPHGAPADQTIGPRSVDQDLLPAADGGDFAKRAKKTQKEPSYRRFAKPTNLALNPDNSPSEEPQEVMDPKTKKKRLRRFLKLARRHKPKSKPAKAD